MITLPFINPQRLCFFAAEDLVEYQLGKEVTFGDEHIGRLLAVENAINPEVAPVADAAVRALRACADLLKCASHIPQSDPVILTVQPSERVEIVDLVSSGSNDEGFNKIITVGNAVHVQLYIISRLPLQVFAALAEEINYLRTIAENKFFAQLSLFGHSKVDETLQHHGSFFSFEVIAG